MMKIKLTLIIKAPQHFTAEGTESETWKKLNLEKSRTLPDVFSLFADFWIA
jgi:hypothetical protein